MKQLLSLLWVTVAVGVGAASGTESPVVPTKAPPVIELRDQFDVLQRLSFPGTNLTLLTIADKKGSDQIAGWVRPIRERFGHQIDIRGIADVSAVPRPLRAMVRGKFQKLQTFPVMLDWSGDVVKAFTYVPDKANVLVLDGSGQILRRTSGEATREAVQSLCAEMEHVLVERAEGLPEKGRGK